MSVKEREFTISDRSGKGKFADVLGDASRWKEEVESFGGGLRPDSPAKMSRPGGMTRGTPDKAPRTMGDLTLPLTLTLTLTLSLTLTLTLTLTLP